MRKLTFFRWGFEWYLGGQFVFALDLTSWHLWYSRRANTYPFLSLALGPVNVTWVGDWR
jgi:hypothetical protein